MAPRERFELPRRNRQWLTRRSRSFRDHRLTGLDYLGPRMAEARPYKRIFRAHSYIEIVPKTACCHLVAFRRIKSLNMFSTISSVSSLYGTKRPNYPILIGQLFLSRPMTLPQHNYIFSDTVSSAQTKHHLKKLL